MRILILHSRYLSGPVSGENRVVEDERRLLLEAGHEIAAWTPEPHAVGGLGSARMAVGAVWSRPAVAEVQRLIRLRRPQIVHCHNLFPSLSPAVIRAAFEGDAAVVVTLHNYRYLCLPATLWRDGHHCEDCLGRSPWPGVVHACYRDSRLASGVLAASVDVHRRMGTFDRVTLFLTVSEFVRSKYAQAGWPPQRMRVKRNFVWPSARREGPGTYFVFSGRLTREKGLDTVLNAWRRIPAKLIVVGDGPERKALEAAAPSNVVFKGAVGPHEVAEVLTGARAVVIPSTWPEPGARGALEAYAAGVPVLANRLGGMPEIVEDGQSGYLLPASDTGAWAAAAESLLDDAVSERMGTGAHRLWKEQFSAERGLLDLEAAYAQAMEQPAA